MASRAPDPSLPPDLFLLPAAIPRLGLTQVQRLYVELGPRRLEELEAGALRRAGLSAAQTRDVLALGADPALVEELRRDARRALIDGAALLDLSQHPLPGLELLDNAPAFLAVSPGFDPQQLDRPRVAIVGTREASAGGLAFTRRLATGLAGEGVLVISGGARGIDSAAHDGAMDAGAPTLAVLGAALDRERPRNPALFDRLWREGAVASEQLVSRHVQSWMFPRRNRLVAALAELVVVVEGLARSGALITAGYARDLGRPVLAVPGRVDDPLAAAPNSLLASGAARACRHVDDVLRALALPAAAAAEPADAAPEAAQLSLLAPDARALLALLRSLGPRAHVDDLRARSGLSDQALAAALLQLELDGLCRREAGACYSLSRSGAAASKGCASASKSGR